MLPAAYFVTVHKICGTFTSLLLLEALFLDKALINLQQANTVSSNPPDGGRLHSLPDINTRLVYIFVPLPLWRILSVYTGSRS